MTQWRNSLRGKPQRSEDRIGGGAIGLRVDPFQHSGQTCGRLMDVVAVGDIDEGFEQLLEAFCLTRVSGRRHQIAGTAARCADLRHSFVLTHPSAFPHGCSVATQSPPVVG